MKFAKYLLLGIILMTFSGCNTKGWQESSNLYQISMHGKIIATQIVLTNGLYIIDLDSKKRLPVKTGSLVITGKPIWGKNYNVLLPTENGIVELNGEKQTVLKSDSMIMSVVYDKDNNQVVYVNGHLEIKSFSMTDNTEKLIRSSDTIGNWISYYNGKIAFYCNGGTKILDLKKNSIVEEYKDYNLYTFSSDGKAAYIKENKAQDGSIDQLIIENKFKRCIKKIHAPWGNDITWSPDGNCLVFTSFEWGFPYRKMRINLYDIKKNKVYLLWHGITSGGVSARSWKY